MRRHELQIESTGHLLPAAGKLHEQALRSFAGWGRRRAFGCCFRAPSCREASKIASRIWRESCDTVFEIRYAAERSESERIAHVLAHDIEALRQARPLHTFLFRPSDDDVMVDALRHFAGRRARRARAVALACVFAAFVGISARDNNANQRADILDLAVAAREIIGFGPGAGEMARRTGAPRAAPIMKSEGK